ncbi:pyruvate ferredoxin oxidoreductase [Prevotella amnii]|jgi:hypothetical protein|uniref:Pyruvate ferredoxin oxidoreductase n=1 Tax=Prevotella amnii DNF00058 TaxID=1401066 RepID=A0A096AZL9_9BACT|nr:pyruvate ferredoxin oxidoreductase [Prevotella amnii]KGF52176.1 pyruvate ferredoxin oxidoreductase [Prevotella amnii DNF00058]
MDYKYIEQLLERYWRCETSLEEEEILRTFFSQEKVPEHLLQYKLLFSFVKQEKDDNVLNDEFDEKVLSIIDEDKPIKAKVITFRYRLLPLFKAAALLAIVLTLGNAINGAFSTGSGSSLPVSVANSNKTSEGPSVAKTDSLHSDSLQHNISVTTSTITK